jgi:tetratricopeptide (TPR) repeat protein
LKPNLATVYLSRPFVLRERGDFNQAFADYDRALDPRYADAWAMRGLLKLRLGQEAGLPEDFDQCLRLKPASKMSLENLVRAQRIHLTAKP